MSSNSLRLFVISYLLLFGEIMAIRWLSAELILLRAFPNLILMVVFISTSIGILSRNKKQASLAVLSFCCLATIGVALGSRWLGFFDVGLKPNSWLMSLTIIGFLTTNLSVIFNTIGRTLGVEFEQIPALKAYSINLIGSILGVLSFAAASFFNLPPTVWVAVCGGCVYYLSRQKSVLLITLAAIIPTTFIYHKVVWSPYGKIEIVADKSIGAEPGDYVLLCNNDFFHSACNLVAIKDWQELVQLCKGRSQSFREYRYGLEIPYLLKQTPKNMLVLGAGSGNDVQCALLHGAQHIDAVEINPVIANCGFNRHPNKPYLDQRVHLQIEDARTFLRYTKEKYDLIQFTYLDPGSTLRANAFLRSDNFVYTRECIASCLRHLKPDGIISLSFATGSKEPATRRLYSTIVSATGHNPLVFVRDNPGSCLFLFGQGNFPELPAELLKQGRLRYWPMSGEYTETRAATDDWPFLYLEFTSAGAIVLYFFVLLCATLGPLWFNRKNFETKILSRESLAMFFVGLAFMLMETKSITQLSLLFGSTWIVTAVVVLVFLMLAFIANLIVSWRRGYTIKPIGIGLILAFLVNLLLSNVPESSTIHPLAIAGITAVVSCLPVLFGGMMFSTILKKSKDQANLLGANLLGTSFGGLLEYICIVAGLKSLTILAMIIYGLSLIALIIPLKSIKE